METKIGIFLVLGFFLVCTNGKAAIKLTKTEASNLEQNATKGIASNKWQQGMSLEARDKLNPEMICVASVLRVSEDGRNVTIHFDGWTEFYDYTTSIDDPDLHPIGYCNQFNIELQQPNNYQYAHSSGGTFDWNSYLTEINSIKAPKALFNQAQLAAPINQAYIMKTPITKTTVNLATAPSLLGKSPSELKLLDLRKGLNTLSSTAKWQPGMSLEARDKLNPQMICVASVVAVSDDEKNVTIHFDDWSDTFDYTTSTNDTDLHPIGYCDQHNIRLQVPRDFFNNHPLGSAFDWLSYLIEINSTAVPEALFSQAQLAAPIINDHYYMKTTTPDEPANLENKSPTELELVNIRKSFKVGENYELNSTITWLPGMSLEARDKMNPQLICVASVVAVSENGKFVTIHFDEWSDVFNYNTSIEDPDLHPLGYSDQNNIQLQPPKNFIGKHSPGTVFDWPSYLAEINSIAVPESLFSANQLAAPFSPNLFVQKIVRPLRDQVLTIYNSNASCNSTEIQPGMRLEAVWPTMPDYIWPATVKEIRDGQVYLTWDGWDSSWDEVHPLDYAHFHPIGYHKLVQLIFYPPPDWTEKNPSKQFDWCEYLTEVKGAPWPYNKFTEAQKSTNNSKDFSILDGYCCSPDLQTLSIPTEKPKALACVRDKLLPGMRLEAFWPVMPGYIWPATIKSIEKNQIHLTWDGWDSSWDEYHPVDHPNFHPIGYHQIHQNLQFYPPPDWTSRNPGRSFKWCEYLAEVDGIPWPFELFNKNQTDNEDLVTIKNLCCEEKSKKEIKDGIVPWRH